MIDIVFWIEISFISIVLLWIIGIKIKDWLLIRRFLKKRNSLLATQEYYKNLREINKANIEKNKIKHQILKEILNQK